MSQVKLIDYNIKTVSCCGLAPKSQNKKLRFAIHQSIQKENAEAKPSVDITNPFLSRRVPDQELVQLVLVLHCLGHEGCPGKEKWLHYKNMNTISMLYVKI